MGYSSPTIIKPGPQSYINETDALQWLPSLLKERHFKKLLIVHGRKALRAAAPFLPSLADFDTTFETYHGECSENEIARIHLLAESLTADAIIAIGGGKVLDIVKAAAWKTNIPEILIPTVPSNCAAFAPLSIIYDDYGTWQKGQAFTRTSHLVLIEPRILLNAPSEYLVAGIGDTIAKWYECRIGLEAVKADSIALALSYESARLCRDRLIENGEQALRDAKNGLLSKAFLSVIDAIFFAAGLVGGLGSRHARAVGGHAFYNSATIIPETHSVPHGTQVAYGLLVQLALENKTCDIKALLPYYKAIGLPVSVHELHLDNLDSLEKVAIKMAEPLSLIHGLPRQVTALDILEAVRTVHKITETVLITQD